MPNWTRLTPPASGTFNTKTLTRVAGILFAVTLAALDWTGREADWIALVCLHSGVFTRAQWCYVFDDPHRMAASRFVRALVDRGVAVEDEQPLFPGGARTVHITHKLIYRALGMRTVGTDAEPRTRPPRYSCGGCCRSITSSSGPTLAWLPTEGEKVRRFDALGIARSLLLYRIYGAPGKEQRRFFALKFPVAVDAKAATLPTWIRG